jgi:hypothetical protein
MTKQSLYEIGENTKYCLFSHQKQKSGGRKVRATQKTWKRLTVDTRIENST